MVSATTNTSSTTTHTYKKDEHFVELLRPLKSCSPVTVFFSFLDPTSYDWAIKREIVTSIRRRVPAGTTVDRYHAQVHPPQEFSQDLTAAWAVARSMQIDDRVIGPLFEAIQGQKKVVDIEGIKAIFDEVGVPSLRFDREYARPEVQKEARWMQEVQRELDIASVPAVVVDGKYLIKLESLGSQVDGQKIADIVRDLLDLKK